MSLAWQCGFLVVALVAQIALGDRAAAQPPSGSDPFSDPFSGPSPASQLEHRVLSDPFAPSSPDVAGARSVERGTSGYPSATAAIETISLTGRTGGAIWGSGIYTSDSDLGTAAVHAGVLKEGETGRVWVTRLPGLESYPASTRHGITSRPWGPWQSSFHLQLSDDQSEPESPPVSLGELRGQIGHVLILTVTGRTTGRLWGTEVYTDDSDIGTAAVHAGLLQDGQRGQVQITILPGRTRYRGSEQNGVTSRLYGRYGGSFWIDPPPSQTLPSGIPDPALPR